jgi:hypothetical protein
MPRTPARGRLQGFRTLVPRASRSAPAGGGLRLGAGRQLSQP